MSQARFLNLDLELRSSVDLSLLSNYFDEFASVLFHGKVGNEFRLTVETATGGLEGDTPERCSRDMLDLLENLPQDLSMSLEQCIGRSFDYGFESGTERPPVSADLPLEILKRIIALGLSQRITLYPPMAPT